VNAAAEAKIMELAMDSRHCATCGKPRGISLLRQSWRIDLFPKIPMTNNNLIVHAGVYRNGGTDKHTHLCDGCLTVGLREIKAHVDELLGAQSPTEKELK
jgi:hypothetical protein